MEYSVERLDDQKYILCKATIASSLYAPVRIPILTATCHNTPLELLWKEDSKGWALDQSAKKKKKHLFMLMQLQYSWDRDRE